MSEDITQKASGILVQIVENPESVEGMQSGSLVVLSLVDLYEYLVLQDLEKTKIADEMEFVVDNQQGFLVNRLYKRGRFADIPKPLAGRLDKASWMREIIRYIDTLPDKEVKAV